MDKSIIELAVTVVGIYFAYFTWSKTVRDKRIHLLKILTKQLDCLGPWMGDKGTGYGEELTEEQKFDNANPLKFIYETGVDPLIGVTLLESMSDVDEEIVGEIHELYYDLVRLKKLEEIRESYVFSQPKMIKSVLMQLRSHKVKHGTTQYYQFINNLTDTQQFFIGNLVHWGSTIHCDVIGNRWKSATQHYLRIKDWTSRQLMPKTDWVFIFITFLTMIFLSFTFFVENQQLAYKIDSISVLIILDVIITIWIAMANGAVTLRLS